MHMSASPDSAPQPAAPAGAPVRRTLAPTQNCVRCGREVPLGTAMCEFCNPLGLAQALRKIDEDPAELKSANRGTAHLYIANPIKKYEARAHSAFASHPPIKDRIRRLERLAHQA